MAAGPDGCQAVGTVLRTERRRSNMALACTEPSAVETRGELGVFHTHTGARS